VSDTILNRNFFELFDLPVSYEVDLGQVQQQYMRLQKQVHPDRFANATDQEKRLSMQQTSWLNEAQQTLKDPVLRASYLLSLKGDEFSLENETTMDAEFLMQQLEMRERLESIREEEDPLDALDSLAKEVKQKTAAMMHGFAQAYEKDELVEAREWIRKLQFMKKAKNEIGMLAGEIEDELMG
jgi:molecular chaperone HscB